MDIGVSIHSSGNGLTNNTIAGRVNGNTNVQILGGTITHDVYGGAALAKSNAGATSYTATVNLLGGTIGGNAYGGGLGDANTAADVGSTKVNLNGMSLSEYNINSTLYSSYLTAIDVNSDGDTTDEGVDYYMVNTTNKGCVVSSIFGANNVNGTPLGDVTVHVYATQNAAADHIAIQTSDTNPDAANIPKKKGRYDVEAVYGGGNEAAYDPTDANNGKTVVVIDGWSGLARLLEGVVGVSDAADGGFTSTEDFTCLT